MVATIAYFVGCTFLSDKWNLPKIYRKGAAWACFIVFAVVLLIANL